jgi:hypothetical protein
MFKKTVFIFSLFLCPVVYGEYQYNYDTGKMDFYKEHVSTATNADKIDGYDSSEFVQINSSPMLTGSVVINNKLSIGTTSTHCVVNIYSNDPASYSFCVADASSNGAFSVYNSLNSAFGGFRFQQNGVDRYTFSRSNDRVIFSRFNASGVWQGDSFQLDGSGNAIVEKALTVAGNITGIISSYQLATVIQNAAKNSNVVLYNGGSSGASILVIEVPSGQEKMRIVGTTGNVGIGKSPGEKLDVNGNVKANSFVSATTFSVGVTTPTIVDQFFVKNGNIYIATGTANAWQWIVK